MTIDYLEGDILNAKTQVVVNTVNCEGFMGKGLALQFKKAYPEMFKEYQLKCKEGEISIGHLHLYKGSPRYWILNFPTKNRWRNKSTLEYIEQGLNTFRKNYGEWGIISIAFPRLGCQLGGLDWKEVKPLMERYLDLPGLSVEIFSPPSDNPKVTKKRARQKIKRKVTNDSKQRTLS
jgi:O-acetyl-ADP-ribose deacetylase (regulator of RNase III)